MPRHVKTAEPMRCADVKGGIRHWLAGVSFFPPLLHMLSFQDQTQSGVLRVVHFACMRAQVQSLASQTQRQNNPVYFKQDKRPYSFYHVCVPILQMCLTETGFEYPGSS